MSGTSFPPKSVTALQTIIPAYVYQQYSDDDNIQAFNTAYNGLAQTYLTWFNSINLPIYTSPTISGALLDWIANGLYGKVRPLLPSGRAQAIGTFNTLEFNQGYFNEYKLIGSVNYYLTTDDIFKRVLTWHYYKGDGKVFSIQWLKRRVLRFLTGTNGTAPDVSNTQQISITFGVYPQANIRLLEGAVTIAKSAEFDFMGFNTTQFNAVTTHFVTYPSLTYAPTFQAAVNAGALELPFQFTWVVSIITGNIR